MIPSEFLLFLHVLQKIIVAGFGLSYKFSWFTCRESHNDNATLTVKARLSQTQQKKEDRTVSAHMSMT